MGNYTDNNVRDCGVGQWTVVLYNPSGPCGMYIGLLHISKDFHVIYGPPKDNGDRRVIFAVPSQNVAYVYDHRFAKQGPEVVGASE